MTSIHDLETPAVLVESSRLDANLRAMQNACSASGTELWPHVKTHKLVPVLKRQLEFGAVGATCAKLGEAEALLNSGVRRIFIAHSLVKLSQADRLRDLRNHLDQLILAVTSALQFSHLLAILDAADINVDVLMAVDTGLGREGVRSPGAAAALAETIQRSKRCTLIGIYTHEGHAYKSSAEEVPEIATKVHSQLMEFSEALNGIALWPGCSVTAVEMTTKPRVHAVRPGAYVFGDLNLNELTKVLPWNRAAATILTTVVDCPTESLALLDAGSKVFSPDRIPSGLNARGMTRTSDEVTGLNEEHGYLRFDPNQPPKIGDRLRFVPAHVCPVFNLADYVYLVDGERVIERWKVDARGRSD